jgi:hypothetical protein
LYLIGTVSIQHGEGIKETTFKGNIQNEDNKE